MSSLTYRCVGLGTHNIISKLFSRLVNADKPDTPDGCYTEPSGKGKGQQHLAGDWTNHPSITVKLLPDPVKRREKPSFHFQRLWTASESHDCSLLIPELLMEIYSSEHVDRMWNFVQINISGHRVPFTSFHISTPSFSPSSPRLSPLQTVRGINKSKGLPAGKLFACSTKMLMSKAGTECWFTQT